jgi:hypothetical protein
MKVRSGKKWARVLALLAATVPVGGNVEATSFLNSGSSAPVVH